MAQRRKSTARAIAASQRNLYRARIKLALDEALNVREAMLGRKTGPRTDPVGRARKQRGYPNG